MQRNRPNSLTRPPSSNSNPSNTKEDFQIYKNRLAETTDIKQSRIPLSNARASENKVGRGDFRDASEAVQFSSKPPLSTTARRAEQHSQPAAAQFSSKSKPVSKQSALPPDSDDISVPNEIEPCSQEIHDQRRLRMLKWQNLQLERELVLLAESSQSRATALIELERLYSGFVDWARTQIDKHTGSPEVPVSRADLMRFISEFESSRIRFTRAADTALTPHRLEASSFIPPGRAHRFLAHDTHDSSLSSILANEPGALRLQHIGALEESLTELFSDLKALQLQLSHLASTLPSTAAIADKRGSRGSFESDGRPRASASASGSLLDRPARVVHGSSSSCAVSAVETERVAAAVQQSLTLMHGCLDDLFELGLLVPNAALKRPAAKKPAHKASATASSSASSSPVKSDELQSTKAFADDAASSGDAGQSYESVTLAEAQKRFAGVKNAQIRAQVEQLWTLMQRTIEFQQRELRVLRTQNDGYSSVAEIERAFCKQVTEALVEGIFLH